MSYKRNQLEAAITQIVNPSAKDPPSVLRTRIKRLLELDRNLGCKHRSPKPEDSNFAFFSEEAPGTGADVSFSEYEAFALFTALTIMAHGWSQSFAVFVMRHVRSDLMEEHARILSLDPKKLFDMNAIRAKARPGDLYVESTDPIFLTVAQKALGARNNRKAAADCAICNGLKDVQEFGKQMNAASLTMWEVTKMAHEFHKKLREVEPRRRGRAPKRTAGGSREVTNR